MKPVKKTPSSRSSSRWTPTPKAPRNHTKGSNPIEGEGLQNTDASSQTAPNPIDQGTRLEGLRSHTLAIQATEPARMSNALFASVEGWLHQGTWAPTRKIPNRKARILDIRPSYAAHSAEERPPAYFT